MTGKPIGLSREEKMIRAVLFDMDGTMFDTERLSMEGWLRAARAKNNGLDREHFLLFRGRSIPANAAAFASWYGSEELYYEMRKIRTEYIQNYLKENGMPIKPGLFELLKLLKKKNLKTCIATSTKRDQAEQYFVQTGVKDYFTDTVCGDEAEKSKPDPEIFLKAAEKISEKPENCLVLEDSPNGILAAKAAGCMAFMIPDLVPAEEEIKGVFDRECASLLEVAEIIETWPDVPQN